MIVRALPINLLEITPKNIPYPEVFLQIEIYYNKEASYAFTEEHHLKLKIERKKRKPKLAPWVEFPNFKLKISNVF